MINKYDGFSLLEMGVAVGAAAMISSQGLNLYSDYLDAEQMTLRAQALSQIVSSADKYFYANQNSLSQSQVVSVNALITSGTLPNLNNPPDLTLRAGIDKTGGDFKVLYIGQVQNLSVPNQTLMLRSLGWSGGKPISATVATGTQNQWSTNPTSYGLTITASDNIAILSSNKILQASGGGSGSTDALMRHAVAGDPSVNQMSTTLDMNGNDITNAKNVTATGPISSSSSIIGQTLKASYVATMNTSDAYCSVSDTSTWGRTARDSTGAQLSCQSGVWRKSGFTNVIYQCPMDGTTGRGSWATIGCIGQYSSSPTCTNLWYDGGGHTYSRSCLQVN